MADFRSAWEMTDADLLALLAQRRGVATASAATAFVESATASAASAFGEPAPCTPPTPSSAAWTERIVPEWGGVSKPGDAAIPCITSLPKAGPPPPPTPPGGWAGLSVKQVADKVAMAATLMPPPPPATPMPPPPPASALPPPPPATQAKATHPLRGVTVDKVKESLENVATTVLANNVKVSDISSSKKAAKRQRQKDKKAEVPTLAKDLAAAPAIKGSNTAPEPAAGGGKLPGLSGGGSLTAAGEGSGGGKMATGSGSGSGSSSSESAAGGVKLPGSSGGGSLTVVEEEASDAEEEEGNDDAATKKFKEASQKKHGYACKGDDCTVDVPSPSCCSWAWTTGVAT